MICDITNSFEVLHMNIFLNVNDRRSRSHCKDFILVTIRFSVEIHFMLTFIDLGVEGNIDSYYALDNYNTLNVKHLSYLESDDLHAED